MIKMNQISTETEKLNDAVNSLVAMDRIDYVSQYFKEKLVMSTSFGTQSAVLLHMVTQVNPDIPIIFIDTGYLFKETYEFAENLTNRLKLNIKTYQAKITPTEQETESGKLWEQGKEGLEKYNFIRKVEPMNRAIKELDATAWISGLRWAQSTTRENLKVIEKQNKIIKIHPIVDWSDFQIYKYLRQHDLPYHPLWDEGYVSVGDWHSTSKLVEGMTAEDTRFNGIKRECGLHEISKRVDFQI